MTGQSPLTDHRSLTYRVTGRLIRWIDLSLDDPAHRSVDLARLEVGSQRPQGIVLGDDVRFREVGRLTTNDQFDRWGQQFASAPATERREPISILWIYPFGFDDEELRASTAGNRFEAHFAVDHGCPLSAIKCFHCRFDVRPSWIREVVFFAADTPIEIGYEGQQSRSVSDSAPASLPRSRITQKADSEMTPNH